MLPDYYGDETPEWEELMRALDAQQYEYDASCTLDAEAIDRTDQIDLHTPGGRYPTITQSFDGQDEPAGWTITFDFEEDEAPRVYTVRRVCEVIDVLEAN